MRTSTQSGPGCDAPVELRDCRLSVTPPRPAVFLLKRCQPVWVMRG